MLACMLYCLCVSAVMLLVVGDGRREGGGGMKGKRMTEKECGRGDGGGNWGNASLARYVQAQGKIMYTYNVKIIDT